VVKVSAPGYATSEQILEVPPGLSPKREASLQGMRIELSRAGATDAGAQH
jgi:hypothetical protein